MRKQTIFLKSAAVVSLVAFAALALANQAGAFTLIERFLNFTNIGIVRGQTVRINVANISDEALNFRFHILDGNGVDHLAGEEATVRPGDSAFVDLDAGRIPGLEGRMQIRGVIEIISRNKKAAEAVLASLEVFENETGRTLLALPAIQHDISIRPLP